MKRSSPVRWWRPAVAIAAVAALGLTACTTPQGSQEPEGPTTLSAYLFQPPTPAFGPLAPLQGGDYLPSTLMFDSLLGVDDADQLIPRLAESWEISDDAMTFTFHLREGVTWTDGEPFTADDVLFTYNTIANPAAGASTAVNYRPVVGVQDLVDGVATTAAGFSAPDENTFVIEVGEPDVGILSIIGRTLILPQHVLGEVPVDQLTANEYFREPVPNLGPYSFVDYKVDQYIELAVNESHYSRPTIDTILLKILTSDVATAQLGTGEIDMVQVSAPDLASIEAMEGVEITTVQAPGFERLSVNTEQERFSDVRVREAMLHAIDRKALVENALQGYGVVVNSPYIGDALPDGLNDYPYDPDLARQLLAEAGWDSSQPVRLFYVPGNRDRDTTLTIVAESLRQVGFNIQIEQKQPAQNLEALKSPPGADAYDIILHGGGNYGDPAGVGTIISCDARQPGGPNNARFCDPEIDAVLDAAKQETDEAARLDLYRQAARMDNEAISYIWLYSAEIIWAHNSRLEGFLPGGDLSKSSFWNVGDWTVTGH